MNPPCVDNPNMNFNTFIPPTYNPIFHIMNLENKLINLTTNMNSQLFFQEKINNLQFENELLKKNISDLQKEIKGIKKFNGKLKQEIKDIKKQNIEKEKVFIDKLRNLEKSMDEIMEEAEEQEEDDKNSVPEDGESYCPKKNDKEDDELNKMVDNIVSDIMGGKNNPFGNIFGGGIVIDMKTGKVISSTLDKPKSSQSQTSQTSGLPALPPIQSPFGDMFGKLFGPKKPLSETIDNSKKDIETQNDFSDLDKIPVENIEDKLEHISDIIKLSEKFPLKQKKPNKLTEVKGLYEYNEKYYGINIETLDKLVKPLNNLNKMIGLDKIKKQILEMILYYMQDFERGTSNMLHTIIEGPPGVGKTEMGKILAEVYSSLRIIPSNKFKLVKRTDLIGEYVGHTAQKTQAVIDEAEGGVLFIDEAYSLGGSSEKSDTYSKECLDVLNQNLSENKKKLIVIIAGYKDQLETSFFSYNPGLKRRFPFKYTIDGYSAVELKDIYLKKLNDIGWKLDESVRDKIIIDFFEKNKDEFKNYGGDIENFILNSKFIHSKRVFNEHPSKRKILNKDDFDNSFERFKENKKNKDMDIIPYGIYI
jgi:hypothetical protein